MVYKFTAPPPQVTRRRTRSHVPRSGGVFEPLVENPDSQIVLLRTIGTDSWLAIIGPDELRDETTVVVVRTKHLQSFTKFRNRVLELTWPPRVLARIPWRPILDRYLRNRSAS